MLFRSLRLQLLLRFQFGEKRVDRRPFLPNELSVGLGIGFILDGLQDGGLLRHFLRLGDLVLRQGVRHGEASNWHRLVVLLLLSSSCSGSSFSPGSDESEGMPTTNQAARLAQISLSN